MTTRVNITLDDNTKQQAVNYAKSLGISLAGLMRMSLKDALNKKNIDTLVIDKILANKDDLEEVSWSDFKQELDSLRKKEC